VSPPPPAAESSTARAPFPALGVINSTEGELLPLVTAFALRFERFDFSLDHPPPPAPGNLERTAAAGGGRGSGGAVETEADGRVDGAESAVA
jgi:hypothetical protein